MNEIRLGNFSQYSHKSVQVYMYKQNYFTQLFMDVGKIMKKITCWICREKQWNRQEMSHKDLEIHVQAKNLKCKNDIGDW